MDTGLIAMLVASTLLVILFVGSLIVVGQAILLRALDRSLEPRVASAFRPEEIVRKDLRAMTFGQQSRGVWQGRGNGALVLTSTELWFSRAVPRLDVSIPLDTVTEVTTVRSHLGKSVSRDLLRVSFRTQDTADAIAWYVTDLNAWRAELAGRVSRVPAEQQLPPHRLQAEQMVL